MQNPRISIITVVFNARKELEKTISSIRSQTWDSLEYVVIDGGSTDGTLDIIQHNADLIDYWVSEPDDGLYDAMNKGLLAATGDYVWFINAGDQIYTSETLYNIFGHQEGPAFTPARDRTGKDPDTSSARDRTGTVLHQDGPGQSPVPPDDYADIYYGDTMIVDENYREIGLRRLRPPEKLTWKSFRYGMLVSHQSILVRRTLADQYDLQLPHSADFDWVVKALKKTDHIVNTGMILSAFLDGGQSKKTIQPSLAERLKSMRQHYGLIPSLLRHIPIAIRFFSYVIKHKRF